MAAPELYIFAISHYCEKARWALDYLDIDYRLHHLSPTNYFRYTRRFGFSNTELPVLVADSRPLQGSAQIIDWAQAQRPSSERSLQSGIDMAAAREIERRLDEIAGVHVRRYYYAEALFDQPQFVRSIFARDLSWRQRLVLRLAWNRIRRYMIRGLDLGPEQGRESRRILDTELQWLDEMLGDGRPFLLGEQFSRVDLSAASLLSPLLLPPQHPVYRDMRLPPGIAAELEAWRDRPTLRWIANIYRQYR